MNIRLRGAVQDAIGAETGARGLWFFVVDHDQCREAGRAAVLEAVAEPRLAKGEHEADSAGGTGTLVADDEHGSALAGVDSAVDADHRAGAVCDIRYVLGLWPRWATDVLRVGVA